MSLDECFEDYPEGVQRRTGTRKYEQDREDLAHRTEWVNLTKPDRADRSHGLVQRIQNAEAQAAIPERARNDDEPEGPQCAADPQEGTHHGPPGLPAVGCHGHWPACRRRRCGPAKM